MKILLLVITLVALGSATFDHPSLVLIKRLYGPQHIRVVSVYLGNLLGPQWEGDVYRTMHRVYHPEQARLAGWNRFNSHSHPLVTIRQHLAPKVHQLRIAIAPHRINAVV